jgi:hypothetical protein
MWQQIKKWALNKKNRKQTSKVDNIQNIIPKKRGHYLKNSSICFVRKSGLSSGMKYLWKNSIIF